TELLLAKLEQVGHGRGERRRLELERHDLAVVVGGPRRGRGGAFGRGLALFGDAFRLAGSITGLVAVFGHGHLPDVWASKLYPSALQRYRLSESISAL